MIPQYRIFYSWQSDNVQAKELLQQALEEVIKQLKGKGIAVQLEQGGGGCGFISIEDSVRIKIRRCDVFVGDVTPVGSVAMKGKLLPNANVMYEMGMATECMRPDRILAVAMKGDWRVEDMPFDFNHYTMLQYDPEKDLQSLAGQIKKRLAETDKISRRENKRFFSERVVRKNIASGKYLPDTFLEDLGAKEKARMFLTPHDMYPMVYERARSQNFDYYNQRQRLQGQPGDFKLSVGNWSISNKTIDIEKLRETITGLHRYLKKQIAKIENGSNDGWLASRKMERLAEKLELMNKQVMVVTSDAGQGKTNFVCDLVSNVLIPKGIPYVFTNAYELSAEQLAKSIAAEYNFIGDYSLEEVLLKAEHFCHQHLQYLIIVIDGLNEHPNQALFRINLTRVLDAVKEYGHVKVMLTCRTQYYSANYQMMKAMMGDALTELNLRKKHGRWDRSETDEERCLIERYAAHFNAKEPKNKAIREELLEDTLLMRIFFHGYQGLDLSGVVYIDYVDLYGRYFDQTCEQIQTVIEQESHAAEVRGMAERIFGKIVAWMVENNVFTNLPRGSVLESLTTEERLCFTAFMSANMLLRQDMTEGEDGAADVLNFTYEQVRDYLVTRYLVDNVFAKDKQKFDELTEKYTTDSNNQAEGTKMFLFLYGRNHDKKDVEAELKKQPWYDMTLTNHIWEIADARITVEDVETVKAYMREHADGVARELAYAHWSPTKHKRLNMQVLIDVLEEKNEEERAEYLEKLWPSVVRERVFGGPVVTQRGRILSVIRAGIARRAKDDKEREVLELLEKYLSAGMERLYVPKHREAREGLPYVLYDYDSYRYLMRVHKGEKKEFMAKAGVGDGYAKEMLGSIYDAIFTEARDVKEMYDSYYEDEYKDYEKFLSMHYSIPSGKVKKYAKVKDEKDYRLIEFDALSYGGDAVSGFVMSDDMIVRMYNWLNWQDDEDKD